MKIFTVSNLSETKSSEKKDRKFKRGVKEHARKLRFLFNYLKSFLLQYQKPSSCHFADLFVYKQISLLSYDFLLRIIPIAFDSLTACYSLYINQTNKTILDAVSSWIKFYSVMDYECSIHRKKMWALWSAVQMWTIHCQVN